MNAQERIHAFGVRPWVSQARSVARTTAEAPSVRGEALAAVTVPPSSADLKTGRSLATASMEVSARTMASSLTVPSGVCTAIVSAGSRPSSMARAALWWERTAISSAHSRVTPHSSTISSACSPRVRPEYGSATTGAGGTRSPMVRFISISKPCSGLRASMADAAPALRDASCCRFDIDSAPPAMAISASPDSSS